MSERTIVRLDRIYTRRGDAGETSTGDGRRVAKNDPRIELCGEIDELNAALGLVLAADVPAGVRATVGRLQNELFDLGADASVPLQNEKRRRLRVGAAHVQWLEASCDEFKAALAPLRSFLLPSGTEAVARLHLARAICRRAERRAVALSDDAHLSGAMLAYLNRLSDLLFILARATAAGDETVWSPGKTVAP
jgi:cob(I)alamin adenosyltransferase